LWLEGDGNLVLYKRGRAEVPWALCGGMVERRSTSSYRWRGESAVAASDRHHGHAAGPALSPGQSWISAIGSAGFGS
jgi:hypothetical protein